MQYSEGDPENVEGVVTVCRIRSGSVFRVPVKVQGQSLFAVVDTAAEVTLISEEVYKSLKAVPPVLKEVIMHTAGRGMQINGFIVGPTEIQLGARVMEANIYVAPISDDMLLGFDLLRERGVALDMLERHLKIGDEVIPMTSGAGGQVPREANVVLDRTVTVPPNSVMRVSCNLSEELSWYVVEACTHDELLVPRTLQAPGRSPIICLMNVSDKHVTIPENEMIARAVEVEILPGKEIELAQGNDPWVCKVQGEDNSLVEEGVPNHLKDLFNKSKANLDTDGQKLSRIPTELLCPGFSTEVELSDLPCKGCKYCAKAHRQWSGFAEDVDYVVPLASKVTPKSEVRRVQGQASSRGQDLDEIHVSRVMILVADGNVIVSPDTGEMSIQVIQDEYGVGLGKYAVDEIFESQGKDPELKWLEKKRLEQGNEWVEKDTLDNPEQTPKQTRDDNPPTPDLLQDSGVGKGEEGSEISRPTHNTEGTQSGVEDFKPMHRMVPWEVCGTSSKMSSASDEGSSKRNNDWKFGREQAEKKKKDKDAGHRGAGSRRPALTKRLSRRDLDRSGRRERTFREQSQSPQETSRGRKRGKAPERWSEACLARTSPRSEWTDTQSDLEGDRSPPSRVVMKSVCIPKGPEGTARQAESRPKSPVQRWVTVDHDPTRTVGPAGGTSKAGSNSSKQRAKDREKRAKENWKRAERRRRAFLRERQENGLSQRSQKNSRETRRTQGQSCGNGRPSILRPALSCRGEDKPSSPVAFQSPKDEEDGFILCPVDGYNVRGINIEPHIRGEHLVEIFQEPSGGLRSNLLVKARFEALQTQSKMILGRVDIWGLAA
ncbi:unnamed protein product [Mytilus coruscus]|uniref:Peptidase A2 domain-containing protein n=1 Tax=Mytilus coruscus TaxID=42192 RepID=A0A6J8B2C5_MYTCO|nr:unnamed protein product [Mytilus coruscus]